ncbi:hypothetical protein B0H17DRAFT_1184978 [Mycena rosella]|uniref:Uncharacterized protein n=1 Tax=Mycena rosella TaxID=1033263 RepID=A0AAD7G717_MYCRO|nr:hypothetical protein B0H17DRAFT_1184978 [Mycena rosella]
MTTCTPGKISWVYETPNLLSLPLLISVSNGGVGQLGPPSSTGAAVSPANLNRNTHAMSGRDTLIQLVAPSTIDPESYTYTWSPVDVPEGWYTLGAAFDSLSVSVSKSAPFYVVQGSNISCIASPSVAASGAITSPSLTAGETAAQFHRAKISRGAIAGGIAGTLVIIITTILFFLRRRRSRFGPPYLSLFFSFFLLPGSIEFEARLRHWTSVCVDRRGFILEQFPMRLEAAYRPGAGRDKGRIANTSYERGYNDDSRGWKGAPSSD